MIIANKDKVRVEGNAIVLINQIELILTAYKNGLIESGETNESAKCIILEAVNNAFIYNDSYRYTTIDKDEETIENQIMLQLKRDCLEETKEERIYSDMIDNYILKENLKRIRR